MAKNKYKVTSEFGTFTRSTDRTYTHLVISKGTDPERIKRQAAESLAYSEKQLAKYTAAVELAEKNPGMRVEIEDGASYNSAEWLRANRKPRGTMRLIVDNGKQYQQGFTLAQWIEYRDDVREEIAGHAAALEAKLARNAAEQYGIEGWCGRKDLADKLAATVLKREALNVHILEVATGKAVR